MPFNLVLRVAPTICRELLVDEEEKLPLTERVGTEVKVVAADI